MISECTNVWEQFGQRRTQLAIAAPLTTGLCVENQREGRVLCFQRRKRSLGKVKGRRTCRKCGKCYRGLPYGFSILAPNGGALPGRFSWSHSIFRVWPTFSVLRSCNLVGASARLHALHFDKSGRFLVSVPSLAKDRSHNKALRGLRCVPAVSTSYDAVRKANYPFGLTVCSLSPIQAFVLKKFGGFARQSFPRLVRRFITFVQIVPQDGGRAYRVVLSLLV